MKKKTAGLSRLRLMDDYDDGDWDCNYDRNYDYSPYPTYSTTVLKMRSIHVQP
jgi:hypothetical protein